MGLKDSREPRSLKKDSEFRRFYFGVYDKVRLTYPRIFNIPSPNVVFMDHYLNGKLDGQLSKE